MRTLNNHRKEKENNLKTQNQIASTQSRILINT